MTRAPASLHMRAAARSKGPPPCPQESRLCASRAVVAKRVQSATAPAEAGREGQRQAKAPQEKQAEKVARVAVVIGIGDCGEGSVGVWPCL